jgi:hypothetical protein
LIASDRRSYQALVICLIEQFDRSVGATSSDIALANSQTISGERRPITTAISAQVKSPAPIKLL